MHFPWKPAQPIKHQYLPAPISPATRRIAQIKPAQDYLASQGAVKQIHIGETGWASETNVMYGDDGSKAADEYKQKAFNDLMRTWSDEFGASLFFFQAFEHCQNRFFVNIATLH